MTIFGQCHNVLNNNAGYLLYAGDVYGVHHDHIWAVSQCVTYYVQPKLRLIGHFTVAYSVTRPMNGSEAAGYSDLAVFIM